jgi:hypothetical protein
MMIPVLMACLVWAGSQRIHTGVCVRTLPKGTSKPGRPITPVKAPTEVPPKAPFRIPDQQGVSVWERSSSLDAPPETKGRERRP